ncbi:EipB family protein [Candidatus Odyssella thessalonicensis]|uniref:EipB family protein n=1 Tax=Candidatus Odyssella thessalonicensis TaxID=84647 RepID=UPI000225C142|nr:DUF1849 family protein [Candidatus Odyssella thessalonicensis]
MCRVLRTSLILLLMTGAWADSSPNPTLWQSFKGYLSGRSSSINGTPKTISAATPDNSVQVDNQEAKTDAPSLGVWGTINRFFQAQTSTPEEPLKTTVPKTEKQEIMAKVDPIPANEVFEHNTPEKIKEAEHAPEHTITPHRARYVITLEKNYGDDISDATGEMTINVYDTGDGLVFEQNSSLIIYNGDGEGERILTNLATWQNYEGTRYRFNSRTVRNGEQEEIIKGEALKDPKEMVTRVTYSRPSESEITTPYETVFPLHHLIRTLEMAKAGKSVVSDVVFDGSSETHEAVNVDTLLGAPKPSGLKIKTDKEVLTKNQWPMRLAVYAPGSKGPEPDYEMVQKVLDCGVIQEMTLDYGAFQVKATLEKIDFYDSNR